MEHARQWIGAATAAEGVADLLEITAGVPGALPPRALPTLYQHCNGLCVNPVELGV